MTSDRSFDFHGVTVTASPDTGFIVSMENAGRPLAPWEWAGIKSAMAAEFIKLRLMKETTHALT